MSPAAGKVQVTGRKEPASGDWMDLEAGGSFTANKALVIPELQCKGLRVVLSGAAGAGGVAVDVLGSTSLPG